MSETSTLISRTGKITRGELAKLPTPPATETHIPIPHAAVVETLVETLSHPLWSTKRYFVRHTHNSRKTEVALVKGDGSASRESAGFGDFAAPREYIPALQFRSLGERLAQEVCARRGGGHQIRR